MCLLTPGPSSAATHRSVCRDDPRPLLNSIKRKSILFSRTKDRGRLKGAENNVTVTLALRIQVFSQTQVGASLEKLLSS
jgi:hypothetical protein